MSNEADRGERPESGVEKLTPMASHVRARNAYNLWNPNCEFIEGFGPERGCVCFTAAALPKHRLRKVSNEAAARPSVECRANILD